jgi:hypothetical protein
MKLFSGSIFCFLLFSNFCNAGDQKPPLWGFPVINKIKNSISRKANSSQPVLSKKPSEEWMDLGILDHNPQDRKKTPSPDIVIVESIKEESKTSEPEKKAALLPSTEHIQKLPAQLQTDIMIAATLGNYKKSIPPASAQNLVESQKPSFSTLESYQNPIPSPAIPAINIHRDQTSSPCANTKNITPSLFNILIDGCCPCIFFTDPQDMDVLSKKKSKTATGSRPTSPRLDSQRVMNAIHSCNYADALEHIENSSIDGDEQF